MLTFDLHCAGCGAITAIPPTCGHCYRACAAECAAQDATRRAIVNAAPPLFSPDELLDLARAAEYMAAESVAADRQGRCAAYLYDLARKARAAL